MWISTPNGIAPNITPTMKTPGVSDSESAPANHVKPTSVISDPKRFSGRRHQAINPAVMKAQPMTGPRARFAVRSSRDQSEVSTRAMATRPAANPATPMPSSARRRLVIR
jgi:hypothetical protein